MPRNHRNSKKRSRKAIKKDHPPSKKTIKAANVALRRSARRRSTAFASSKITTNRLTLPLTFLDNGIKSETVTAAREEAGLVNGRKRHILNEDLLALIPTAEIGADQVGSLFLESSSTRRITRSLHNRFLNASSYYLNCINKHGSGSDIRETDPVPLKSDKQTDTSVSFKKSQEVFENSHKTEFKNVLIQTTETTILNSTINEKYRPANYNFCRNIFSKVAITLKSSKKDCISKLKEAIKKVNDILDGNRSPTSPVKNMSAKRLCDEDYDKVLTTVPLVPQSQWVYSTPDKQNMKQFVFEDGSDKILPAVIRTSRKSKVLYDIKNEVVQHVNLNKFSGQSIPIDRRYLKTICEKTIVGNDDPILPKPSKKQRTDVADDSNKENLFTFVAPAKKSNEFVFQPQTRCIVTAASVVAAAAPASNVSNSGNKNAAAKDEFNVFLSGGSEESIDIQQEMIQRGTDSNAMDVSFESKTMEETMRKDLCEMEEKYGHFDFRQCRSALPKDLYYLERDPYETAPVDYRHQLLMATQRPAKTTRKIQKRHLLKAKSLSFDNTPPGAKVAVFEPKRIDMLRCMEEDCIDQFEKEFCVLNTNSHASNLLDIPHTITSGALMNEATTSGPSVPSPDLTINQFEVNAFNDNLQAMFKFYPRRNFDPE